MHAYGYTEQAPTSYGIAIEEGSSVGLGLRSGGGGGGGGG
jgi:hypothetical protein